MDTSKRRVYSAESRQKMSKSKLGNKNASGKHKSFTRSKFLVIWITDGKQEKRIKVGEEIPQGFHLGRTLSEDHKKHLSESMTKTNQTTNKEKLKLKRDKT